MWNIWVARRKILTRAHKSYKKGEYRWVGMVVNHVVFAEPDNMEARYLLAEAYEQLGYQAESGPWRNFYLTGARELRYPNRVQALKASGQGDLYPTSEELSKLSAEEYFNYVAIHLNGPKANGRKYDFKLQLLIDNVEAGDEPGNSPRRAQPGELRATRRDFGSGTVDLDCRRDARNQDEAVRCSTKSCYWEAQQEPQGFGRHSRPTPRRLPSRALPRRRRSGTTSCR